MNSSGLSIAHCNGERSHANNNEDEPISRFLPRFKQTCYDPEMIRGTGRGPKEKSAEELSDNDEREENQKVRTLRD